MIEILLHKICQSLALMLNVKEQTQPNKHQLLKYMSKVFPNFFCGVFTQFFDIALIFEAGLSPITLGWLSASIDLFRLANCNSQFVLTFPPLFAIQSFSLFILEFIGNSVMCSSKHFTTRLLVDLLSTLVNHLSSETGVLLIDSFSFFLCKGVRGVALS